MKPWRNFKNNNESKEKDLPNRKICLPKWLQNISHWKAELIVSLQLLVLDFYYTTTSKKFQNRALIVSKFKYIKFWHKAKTKPLKPSEGKLLIKALNSYTVASSKFIMLLQFRMKTHLYAVTLSVKSRMKEALEFILQHKKFQKKYTEREKLTPG